MLLLLVSLSTCGDGPLILKVHHRGTFKPLPKHRVLLFKVDEITVYRRPLVLRLVNRTRREVVFQPDCGRVVVRKGSSPYLVTDHRHLQKRKVWPRRTLPPGKPVAVCTWDLKTSFKVGHFGRASGRSWVAPGRYTVLLGGRLWVNRRLKPLGGHLAATVRIARSRVFKFGRPVFLVRNSATTDAKRRIVIAHRFAVSKRTQDGNTFFRGDITVWQGAKRYDLRIRKGRHSDAVPGIRIHMQDVRPYRGGILRLLVKRRP
jgi:hypothetical protein